MEPDLSWYVVMCEPRAEQKATNHLREQGYSVWYPHYMEYVARGRYRTRVIRQPYMQRYIFVGLGAEHHSGLGHRSPNLYPINESRGVSTVIYAPGGLAFPLPAAVMRELKSRADPGGLISKQKPRFGGDPGDSVLLAEASPYWNFMCEILRVDEGDKIVVLLDTMGRKVPTLIRPEDVQEIHTKAGEVISKDDPRMCRLA